MAGWQMAQKEEPTMPANSHLTFDERLTIETSLKDRMKFAEIARTLGKDPSTISKEIRSHTQLVKKDSYNPCVHRQSCRHYSDACPECLTEELRRCRACHHHCYLSCPDFQEETCGRLEKPPYVCNGCPDRSKCRLQRHLYSAKQAQKEYEVTRSESRRGVSVDPQELKRIDDIVAPLVRQGQSIHQICVSNADRIMMDEKTIYNYIDAGLLSVGNLDLPRKVRYRPRKRKKEIKVDKQCYVGRTYDDFTAYMAANPDTAVVQMDTVEGRKGGKVLLTLHFCSSSLMLAFLRDHNTARSITDIYNDLYDRLGHEWFTRLFPVILTDRGSEFTDPQAIEFNQEGKRRTRVFFCNPQSPWQKGCCEVNHELLRRIIPKGSSLDNMTQEDVSMMMNHINSYNRRKLNDRSAHQLFSFLHGEDVMHKLDITEIPADEIVLTPSLIKK